MIKEALIEEILEQIESEKFEDNFATAQAEYWHYLNSESFKGLSTPEHQLSYFISSVIFHAATASETELPDFDIEQFQQLEEQNWEERETHKNWSAAKDAFFEEYEEEDLLAFVEDMLADEEGELSDIAKEVIFITAKSYIDFLVGV